MGLPKPRGAGILTSQLPRLSGLAGGEFFHMKIPSGTLVKLTCVLTLAVLFTGCTPHRTRKPTPVADVIPMTTANLRGHKMIYKEGWMIITSTQRSLEYAKRTSIDASWQALVQVARDVKAGSRQYVKDLGDNYKASWNMSVNILKTGQLITNGIFAGTHYIGKLQWQQANTTMILALDTFVQGNLSIAGRTAEDREALAAIPGDLYQSLSEDFTNLHILSHAIKKKISRGIPINWEKSFARASEEFRLEYEESGKRQNSMVALGDILVGYLKAFYHGVAHPGARTIVKATVKGFKYGVFLPAASILIVSGRTIQATGLALFYTSKIGVKVISPTVEGGFLAAFGLLSYGTVPLLYGGGATLGAFSQVAFSTVAPVAGTARATTGTALATGDYVVGTFTDALTGTTKVVINQLKSGVVLGYNALTAIPAHLYLGSIDSAIFLAWDGPRLVIAMARGTVSFTTEDNKKEKVSVGALPVGTVVDLKKLKKHKGVKVEIISTDPEVIKNVLRKVPADSRRDSHEDNH